jgi:hypothetical protein
LVMRSTTTRQKNDFSSATITIVDSETGMVASQEAEEEAEVEEQRVAAVVAHAQSSGVPAVEASGKFFYVVCYVMLL